MSKKKVTTPAPKAPDKIHNWRKCPRCGATDTVAYARDGEIQYRKCRRATCRSNFKTIVPE